MKIEFFYLCCWNVVSDDEYVKVCVCQQQLKARLNPLQILFSANMQGFCL